MAFYRAGPRASGDFETGIQHALARILVAPAVPLPHRGGAGRRWPPGTAYAISDLALASRLSFFLWSSIPDDQLLDLAAQGRLSNRAVLAQQVRAHARRPEGRGAGRELRRPVALPARARQRADRGAELRRQPAPVVPARDRAALRQHRPRGPQPRSTLLDADYTFVDERLARHYGIPNVYGSYFRRVHAGRRQPAPRPARPGQHADRDVGGHAHLAGVARQVGAREPARHAAAAAAARRRGEPRSKTRRRPSRPRCGSGSSCTAPTRCARRATRSWTRSGSRSRTSTSSAPGARRDGAGPIDSTGQLADGTPLKGPPTCARRVLGRTDAFMTVATEKLLIYALGRPLHATDMSTVRGDRRAGARRRPAGSRRWCSASSQSAPFRLRARRRKGVGESKHMAFLTRTHLSRRTFLRGVGVIAGAAAARLDDAGGHAPGRRRRPRPRTRLGAHLLPARRHHEQVDAGHGGRRLRADARSCSRSSRSTTRSTWSAACGTRWPTAAAPRPITTARPRRS